MKYCGKYRPQLGFYPRTVQPVASCYTDWSAQVHLDLQDSGEDNIGLLTGQDSLSDFFLNNQPDALIIQIYSVIKLYMFRATSLPIIRSFLLYIRHW